MFIKSQQLPLNLPHLGSTYQGKGLTDGSLSRVWGFDTLHNFRAWYKPKINKNQTHECLVMSDYGCGVVTAPLLLGIDPSNSEQTEWKFQLITD